jgi:hypothetical protein
MTNNRADTREIIDLTDVPDGPDMSLDLLMEQEVRAIAAEQAEAERQAKLQDEKDAKEEAPLLAAIEAISKMTDALQRQEERDVEREAKRAKKQRGGCSSKQ